MSHLRPIFKVICTAFFSIFSIQGFSETAIDRSISASIYIGGGKASFGNSFENVDFDVRDNIDYVSMRWSGAYTFSNQFMVQGALNSNSNFNIFGAGDEYYLTEEQIFIGYKAILSKDSYFIPKIGMADWKLEAREGALFNPGPEDNAKVSGKDMVVELEIGRAFTNLFSMSIYASYMDAGEVTRTNSGIGFNFHF